MRDYDESISPSFRNAFTPEFLQRIGERDEPVTAAEADVAGPWHVEEIPGSGWGLYRQGAARQFRPYGIFRDRALALLFAAVLPGTGRDKAFRLRTEPAAEGFLVESPEGEVVGALSLFDETLVAMAHAAEALVRSPESLANLLEAAGGLALEHAGVILDARLSDPDPDHPHATAASA